MRWRQSSAAQAKGEGGRGPSARAHGRTFSPSFFASSPSHPATFWGSGDLLLSSVTSLRDKRGEAGGARKGLRQLGRRAVFKAGPLVGSGRGEGPTSGPAGAYNTPLAPRPHPRPPSEAKLAVEQHHIHGTGVLAGGGPGGILAQER